VPYYRVTLAYDGTAFEGWQLQRGTRQARTVQGVLESVLSRLQGGSRVAVSGAGRTDAGVHALGQVAAFDLARPWSTRDLLRALNGLLPPDVRVLEAAPAPATFHPRRSALSKLYRYEIDTVPVQLPWRRFRAAHVREPLDRAAMEAVARLFMGRQDFACLASAGGSVSTTIRTVMRSDLETAPEGLAYETEADGFLRRMVRSMVGGLLSAGRGDRTPSDLARALASRDRRAWPPPAPAPGLTLVSVRYAPEAVRVVG
jgi:tRNA pseudouridine38-40 synthase